MSEAFVKGQRWMSEAEPEMGLGLVVECEFRQVRVLFPATGETRLYSSENAPLKRVQFQVGDNIDTPEGVSMAIEKIKSVDGLFHYHCGKVVIPEMHLADTIQLSLADRRLLDGRVDDSSLFDLRSQAWVCQSRVQSHPAHGYMGARMDLIGHQLYIAHEVASRTLPRVLLADEVGLGKTIEACLILHRLMVKGRAGRVLILVPEPLVHQWFVELLRRFNLTCAIYDEERCVSIQGEGLGGEAGGGVNPFLEEHLILTSMDLFKKHPERLREALDVDWGMVIVDEVHHLKWEPDPLGVSWEYSVVEAFSRLSKGLLLLTGTPEQFGEAGHFARLRLLDPDRFHNFERFCQEVEAYQKTAEVVDKLILNQPFARKDGEQMRKLFEGVPRLRREVGKLIEGNLGKKQAEGLRGELIEDLLDRHGTGRVVFRNTRSAISGFPKRRVYAEALSVSGRGNGDVDYEALASGEMRFEFGETPGKEGKDPPGGIGPKDPRIDWLVRFLECNPDEKLLLICRYRERACEIHEALVKRLNIRMSVFHEGLSLLQRDRNAAWFAEKDGAQLLICSEIGSEGRNFQFAHHLVLFDLPLDPELLEQRIGRLDRIGQKSEIHIHVLYFKGTGGEQLFRWFHEGLDAFEHTVQGGALFMERFQERLREILLNPGGKNRVGEREGLIAETRQFREELAKRLEQGRDRLLELNSFQPARAKQLIQAISEWDSGLALESFMSGALDHYGIHIEEMGARRWLLTRGHLLHDDLAVIPDEGKMVTLDRKHALERDDVEFLTWDHPLVTSVLDFLLGSETGNAAFVEVAAGDHVGRGLYVEMIYILEGGGPSQYDLKRFLPTLPIRVFCDQNGKELSGRIVRALEEQKKKDIASHVLSGNEDVLKELLGRMKKSSEGLAAERAGKIRGQALGKMRAFCRREQERLQDLRSRNGLVSEAEVKLLKQEAEVLEAGIQNSGVRLDAIRLYRAV